MRDAVLLEDGDYFIVRTVDSVPMIGPLLYFHTSPDGTVDYRPNILVFRITTYQVYSSGELHIVSQEEHT